jgi:beta-xylosidase
MKCLIFVLYSILLTVALGEIFTNPVIWEDLADNDVFRVNDTYYYTASTMHYSPGAPILKSYDLVNWEYVGHAVPSLPWGSKYNLENGSAYVKGIFASTMRYRPSMKQFYWIGCIEYSHTYVYTSASDSVTSTWSPRSEISTCYYDCGLLIDDDDTMYVSYGNTQISVAQLSADGLSQVRTEKVYSTPASIGTLEGSRMYKINGNYYIFSTKPANGQYVLKANNPFGPYTIKQLLLNLGTPISGGGVPHQGSLVQTQNGTWYYMAFVDSYPGGRMPVLAPITWGSDGFPSISLVGGSWGTTYDYPTKKRVLEPLTGMDSFNGTTLGAQWEWNHNPDTTKYSVKNCLILNTATVTSDLYAARNTITRRILGPTSSGTIFLDYSKMADGDRAGLALLRDTSAWIGIVNTGGTFAVSFWSGLTMTSTWATSSKGSQSKSATISGGKIWLRIYADIHVGTGRQGMFYYSTDGKTYTLMGSLTLNNAWNFFMGYRYGIFNYATKALGGSVTVGSFTMDSPGYTTDSG